LQKPQWLFLDEATSALDEAAEAELYRLLLDRLPHTAIISIGHRASLVQFHARFFELTPEAPGRHRLAEAVRRKDARKEGKLGASVA
jgi:putative ATP-binding cassette transporter